MRTIHKFFRDSVGFADGFLFTIFYCTALGQHHSDTTLMRTPINSSYILKMVLALMILCLILHWFSKGIKADRKSEGITDLFLAFIVLAISAVAGMAITFEICKLIG